MLIANTRHHLPAYFWGMNLLLGMFCVYGIYLMIGGYNPSDYVAPVPTFYYLKNILISLVPLYPFYVFSKEGLINEKFIRILFFVLLGLTIANYYGNYRKNLFWAMSIGSQREEFTNNIGYGFLSLVPFCVFFYKRPVLQYSVLAICMIFLIMSMKRGAIIIGVLCLVWFIWNNLRVATLKKKMGILTLSLGLCFVGYMCVEKQMQESNLFQKRIENTLDGDSSGRDKLYGRFIDYFLDEATPLQFAFGSGADATLKVSYNYAHNDWLEIAVNQGVFGLIIYMVYWMFFGWTVLSNKYDSHVKCALQILFLIYFMKTIFSMSYNDMTIGATFVLGYCLTQEEKK